MGFHRWLPPIVMALCLGCASPSRPVAEPIAGGTYLPRPDDDGQLVPRSAEQMRQAVAEIDRIGQIVAGSDRDHLLPQEQDALERSLLSYLGSRETLLRIAAPYRADARSLPAEGQSAIDRARSAAVRRIHADALLVASMQDDAVMSRALNQSFHRSGIPRGVYNGIAEDLTHPKTQKLLDAAMPDADAAAARGLVRQIARHRLGPLPEVANGVKYAPPTQLLLQTGRVVKATWNDARSGAMAGVRYVKNPMAQRLRYTDEQRRQIHDSLRPGDVLLSYTAGVASNLFLPGKFKHAIAYVGVDWQRRAAGLTPEFISMVPEPQRGKLLEALADAENADDPPADVVESMADGVNFNNLDQIIDTRVNRLLVLRPRLNPADRASAMVDVISLVGADYDFTFDFADVSGAVCTEVIYRSLQGRGGIDFRLVERAGHKTLSPDDIVQYCLERSDGPLECVLLVEEDPRAKGAAQVLTGDSARARLIEMMRLQPLSTDRVQSITSQQTPASTYMPATVRNNGL